MVRADELLEERCLRGIDTLTALALAAEIGDFSRFKTISLQREPGWSGDHPARAPDR